MHPWKAKALEVTRKWRGEDHPQAVGETTDMPMEDSWNFQPSASQKKG
jgi:hypothetical protein